MRFLHAQSPKEASFHSAHSGVAWAGVIAKLVDKNVAIDVHQPEKPNPFLRTLGDVAFPLLTIAGIRDCCNLQCRYLFVTPICALNISK